MTVKVYPTVPSICEKVERKQHLDVTDASTSGSSFSIGESNTSSSPVMPIERKNGLSATATLINFLKGMIGPGCLSLPLAFKQAGLWTAFALVFIFGFLNNYCMLQLVHCSQYLSRRKGDFHLDYGNVAYQACATSFKRVRKHRLLAKLIVNAAVVGLQVGICSVFYVFVAVHLKEISEELDWFYASSTAWMFVILAPMVALSFFRSLRAIAVLSAIGNILMLLSLVFIFQHLVRSPHVTSTLPAITDFDGIMTACGSILYSFEGQAMVLPMENRLKHPEDMIGATGVLSTGMGLVSIVYAASGFFGYITYGKRVEGSITLNLPAAPIFITVKFLLVLVIYFGFVVQQYVIVDTLWPTIKARYVKGRFSAVVSRGLEYTFRAACVVLSMLIAIAVPNLDQIIPLVGVTAGMLLAFVFPALLDTLTFVPVMLQEHTESKDLHGKTNKGLLPVSLRVVQNVFLMIIGIFGLVAGLQSNIREMTRSTS